MTLGIRSSAKTAIGGSYRGLVILSAVVLAISVSVSLLFAPSRSENAAPDMSLPKSVPELKFEAADGTPVTLADFRGRIVLLNIWATWCGPCRKEMPALDRLQAKLGGPGFQVLALSIDRSPDRIQPFFDEIGIKNLSIYTDRSSAAMAMLDIVGVPTTLLIDREGREIQRWVGPAEWDSPEIESLIRRQLNPTVSRTEISSFNSKVKQ